jgi:hypothetical protein
MRRKSVALGRPQAGRVLLDHILGLTAPAAEAAASVAAEAAPPVEKVTA